MDKPPHLPRARDRGRVPLPPELAALAVSQGGPFTRAQVLHLGLSPHGVRVLLAAECTRIGHGTYVQTPVLLAAQAEPRQLFVLRAAARALVHDGAVVSHRSALVVHDLPLLGRLPWPPELTREPRREDDRSSVPHLRVAALPTDQRTTFGGVPVVTAARAVVDVGRTAPLRDAVVAADAVLRRGTAPTELARVAASCAGWPGALALPAVLAAADGRAETPIESLTRLAYAEQGLPAPQPQVQVFAPDGSFVGLVDFLWQDQRVVGEADGMAKYDRPGALREEKLREGWLRRCGIEVVRNNWDDVWRPAGRRDLGERVRAGFAYSSTRPVVEGVRFRVPTLAELTRVRAA